MSGRGFDKSRLDELQDGHAIAVAHLILHEQKIYKRKRIRTKIGGNSLFLGLTNLSDGYMFYPHKSTQLDNTIPPQPPTRSTYNYIYEMEWEEGNAWWKEHEHMRYYDDDPPKAQPGMSSDVSLSTGEQNINRVDDFVEYQLHQRAEGTQAGPSRRQASASTSKRHRSGVTAPRDADDDEPTPSKQVKLSKKGKEKEKEPSTNMDSMWENATNDPPGYDPEFNEYFAVDLARSEGFSLDPMEQLQEAQEYVGEGAAEGEPSWEDLSDDQVARILEDANMAMDQQSTNL